MDDYSQLFCIKAALLYLPAYSRKKEFMKGLQKWKILSVHGRE